MRTKKEIWKYVEVPSNYNERINTIQLEILLDIRDLLVQLIPPKKESEE